MSMANARADAQIGCSPKERLPALFAFFEWADAQSITVIGCTEGGRAQNGMDWERFQVDLVERYAYWMLRDTKQGDKSEHAFTTQLYMKRDADGLPPLSCDWTKTVKLSPPELHGTRHYVRAPTLWLGESLEKIDCKLMYCHLSLSRNGQDEAYQRLVYELRTIRDCLAEGYIAFGDFNLTNEVRERLYSEQELLMDQLEFQFGYWATDYSFLTFPHDHVPLSAFTGRVSSILQEHDDGCNGISALDAVCGAGVHDCHRHLPWAPYAEIPLHWTAEQVIDSLRGENKPPEKTTDWVSDHWILVFTV